MFFLFGLFAHVYGIKFFLRIKQGILQALVNEQERLVKNAIAQFIGIIGKHEFPNKTWPEVLQFVQSLCSSQNVLDREVGTVSEKILYMLKKIFGYT